jgi:hypothetical protein
LQLDKKAKSAIAAYIMGFAPEVKITGGHDEIKAFSRVLESSRDVYNILQGKPTIERLTEALADKSMNANAFKKATGQAWPF